MRCKKAELGSCAGSPSGNSPNDLGESVLATASDASECAHVLDRSRSHKTRLANLPSGCQFGQVGAPWTDYNGMSWCRFHLPEAAKRDWTEKQRNAFGQELQGLILDAARERRLLDLSGVVVPGSFRLGNTRKKLMLPNALLLDCVFMGDVTFENVSFSGWAYFDGTHFCDQALLDGTTYCGEASFNRVDFGPNVHFGNSHFRDNAYFQGARFPLNTWCSDVRFAGRAWFQEAVFGGISYFERCSFGGDADYSTDHPGDPHLAFPTISFEGSTFKDTVSFTNRRFSNRTRFTGAVFHLAPEFYGCQLHEDTDLTNTTFLDQGQAKRSVICGVTPREVDSARAYRTLRRAMEHLRDTENEGRFFALEKEAIRGSKSPHSDTSEIDWTGLADEDFERLIFQIISSAKGYENVRWLQHTKAPDRGRDLSAERVVQDDLGDVRRLRTVVQCKHWLSKSVGTREIGETRTQMQLWQPPRIDILIVATSGRFTADAVALVEKHNQSDTALHIVLWPGSHIERLLDTKPHLITGFGHHEDRGQLRE